MIIHIISLFSTRESNSNRHYISYNADVKDELFAYDHTNNNNKIQTNVDIETLVGIM